MKLDPRRVKVTEAPLAEPVSLAEAKLQVRVSHNTEDALLTSYILTARRLCEQIARRTFMEREYTGQLDDWPLDGEIVLPYPPLVSVDAITYTDDDSTVHTLDSALYAVDTHSDDGRIVLRRGSQWPTARLDDVGAIEIVWTAGYEDADDVPEEYKQAILLLVGHFYENRESVIMVQGMTAAEVPWTIRRLLYLDRAY
jgi:uncharacterized phiE125 gp8 family phage protein